MADQGRARTRRPLRNALLAVLVGLLLVTGSVVALSRTVAERYTAAAVPAADLFGDGNSVSAPPGKLTGPVNLLLVGIDRPTDQPERIPRADTVLVVHIPAGLSRAYLISLPRDLLVDIPAFGVNGHPGGVDRINAAMAYGSRVPGAGKPDPVAGFQLLAATVSARTGIEQFDAGVIVNFAGLERLVDAIGGVRMHIDSDVRSRHRQPDGRLRPSNPDGPGYVGPQAEYRQGEHRLSGWQALDYVRQRESLPDGDYGRQRHQRQLVRALAEQVLTRDLITDPMRLGAVLEATGDAVVVGTRGRSVLDFALGLRQLRADDIVLLDLPGTGVTDPAGEYLGERFTDDADGCFRALRAGTLDQFVLTRPELVNRER
ncbi:LCP family protein [Micromonospora sp. NBC_01813]|uniref:LCP family protein n=1 Tax=Micromonospora sp. NBC_01813 TaxID=2975988 RepID=UPI002DD838CE|nr:LCP family protein [Micromonospora sp. NBC_01813]WSA08825.1 LCP family protein [Micromonospora sp. NBC_01813]